MVHINAVSMCTGDREKHSEAEYIYTDFIRIKKLCQILEKDQKRTYRSAKSFGLKFIYGTSEQF